MTETEFRLLCVAARMRKEYEDKRSRKKLIMDKAPDWIINAIVSEAGVAYPDEKIEDGVKIYLREGKFPTDTQAFFDKRGG